MNRAIVVSMMAIAIALDGGCSFNTAPIHSELSDAEFDSRLRSRFTLGMAGTDAVIKLNNAGLEHTATSIPPRDKARDRDRGIRVLVRPPGVRLEVGKLPPQPTDTMYLWFTLDDSLEQIGYERSRFAEPRKDVEPGMRIVPLDEEHAS